MMQEMAKGHLGMRLKMDRSDEIGILANAMDGFAEDLQKNVVATVIKIGEGDLTDPRKWSMIVDRPKAGTEIKTPPLERPVLYKCGNPSSKE